MALEIERKFLVKNDRWRPGVEQQWNIVQGYLATTGTLTLRVRVKDDDCLPHRQGAAARYHPLRV